MQKLKEWGDGRSSALPFFSSSTIIIVNHRRIAAGQDIAALAGVFRLDLDIGQFFRGRGE